MCFLPQDEAARQFAVKRLEHFIKVEGQKLVGWRDVPTDTTGLGKAVIERMPVIRQAIVGRGAKLADQDAFERKILAIRKQTQNPLVELEKKHKLPGLSQLYMPSFSTRTVVYKGLLLAPQVESFYEDLRNPLTESALCLVHQRFSTNTFPSWKLAHPYRFIAHNGEINTVRGNVNWMYARRRTHGIRPARRRPRQDVADHPARPVRHRLRRQRARAAGRRRLLAGARHDDADPGGVGRQSADGCQAQGLLRISRRADGAVGRPGLRSPSPTAARSAPRSTATACARRASWSPTTIMVVMASEAGVLPIPEEKIVRKWRLQPGKMLLIDLEQGRIVEDEEIKRTPRRGRALRGVAEARPSTSSRSCRSCPTRRCRRRRTIRRPCSIASRPSATPRRTSSSSSSR